MPRSNSPCAVEVSIRCASTSTCADLSTRSSAACRATEIEVDCSVDDVTASPDAATSISIIVNELVTNAIKHAFNGEGSGHVWVKGNAGSAFELIVADDGRGISSTRRDGHSGLGSKLVESFARQLGAAHEVVSTTEGTTHRLLIPQLD